MKMKGDGLSPTLIKLMTGNVAKDSHLLTCHNESMNQFSKMLPQKIFRYTVNCSL